MAQSAWYAPYVDTAAAYGIVNGGGLVADCLVSTNPNISCGDIPVVPGVALLTGMGEEAVLEQVYQIVKD